jgi:hypothetical protein
MQADWNYHGGCQSARSVNCRPIGRLNYRTAWNSCQHQNTNFAAGHKAPVHLLIRAGQRLSHEWLSMAVWFDILIIPAPRVDSSGSSFCSDIPLLFPKCARKPHWPKAQPSVPLACIMPEAIFGLLTTPTIMQIIISPLFGKSAVALLSYTYWRSPKCQNHNALKTGATESSARPKFCQKFRRETRHGRTAKSSKDSLAYSVLTSYKYHQNAEFLPS